MNARNQSTKAEDGISLLEVSDDEFNSWMLGGYRDWLKAGLPWSQDLTVLECAFLHPGKFFRTARSDELVGEKAWEQSRNLLRILRHIRVPERLRAGKERDKVQFLFSFDREGLFADLEVADWYDDGKMKGREFCRCLDLNIAVHLDLPEEALFLSRLYDLLFGGHTPSFDVLAKFMKDQRNFDFHCDHPHETGYLRASTVAAGFTKRVGPRYTSPEAIVRFTKHGLTTRGAAANAEMNIDSSGD